MAKPESDLYVDCSPEQIQKVIDAAWELKNISQDDFWDAVDTQALRDLKGVGEELAGIESERDLEGELAGLPDGASSAQIQRYEAEEGFRTEGSLGTISQSAMPGCLRRKSSVLFGQVTIFLGFMELG